MSTRQTMFKGLVQITGIVAPLLLCSTTGCEQQISNGFYGTGEIAH